MPSSDLHGHLYTCGASIDRQAQAQTVYEKKTNVKKSLICVELGFCVNTKILIVNSFSPSKFWAYVHIYEGQRIAFRVVL